MHKESKIAAFEGGALRMLEGESSGHEAVLALPLNRLLVKMVRVPVDADPVETARPILQAMSPYPDEPLTIGFETVRSDEKGSVILAAALPESATDDIGTALDAAKLNVVRIDLLILGLLRGMWEAIDVSAGRKLLLVASADCLSLVVLEGDQPLAIRAVNAASDLKREVMLSLLEAEEFGGAGQLTEIVCVGEVPEEGLSMFAPVRRLEVGEDVSLVGVRDRALEEGSLDATPASWREVLAETRFKAKVIRNLAWAGGVWLLVMGILFGVPVVYGFLTDHQKDLSRQHMRQYKAVCEMRDKTALVKKYSDHTHGALEIMKALSDRLPEGITLSSWNYKRGDGVTVSGEAESDEQVYNFKDAMDGLFDQVTDEAGETTDGEKIFNAVDLSGLKASRGMYQFNLGCRYKSEEEE